MRVKIIEIQNCWECPYHNTIKNNELGCTQTGEIIKNTSVVDSNCPLENKLVKKLNWKKAKEEIMNDKYVSKFFDGFINKDDAIEIINNNITEE